MLSLSRLRTRVILEFEFEVFLACFTGRQGTKASRTVKTNNANEFFHANALAMHWDKEMDGSVTVARLTTFYTM